MPLTSRADVPHALAVYAETLAVRRRVVVLGGDEALAERLSSFGARQVVVLQPGDDGGDLRPSSFDLAFLADLGQWDDPEQAVALARQLVGDAGAVLVSAANRDAAGAERAFDYYELFDLVARHFGDVRMIAEMPFEGVALAELGGDGEALAVSVDTQLVDEQRVPSGFVVLASERGARLDPYAIIELPPGPQVVAVSAASEEELDGLRADLAREKLRADALAGHLETTRADAARASALERELAARGREVAALSAEVEGLRASVTAGASAIAQLEDVARRASRAEGVLRRIEPELARSAEAHAEELAGFEGALRERAQTIRRLEAEVARRDRMVHELVATLEEHGHGGEPPAAAPEPSDEVLEENARLRERLDALALELARHEGEARAAEWRVGELERRLAREPAPTTLSDTEATHKLAAALDELDALRRALTQEHEERVRAEAALEQAAEGGSRA